MFFRRLVQLCALRVRDQLAAGPRRHFKSRLREPIVSRGRFATGAERRSRNSANSDALLSRSRYQPGHLEPTGPI